jgi:predicted permease
MDIKFVLRSLRKNPGFTLVVVLVLGLGIGANTAIFSVVNTVLLKPLDYSEPDRIVTVASLNMQRGTSYQVSAPDFRDWRDQSDSFEAFAYHTGGETSVTVGTEAEYATVMAVTPGFFRVFGVDAIRGRLLTADEEKQGGPLAAVISYAFWQRRFQGSAQALGGTVSFGQRTFNVVGVLPPSFRYPATSDVWYSAATTPETTSRTAHNYRVIARLKPGVTVAQAQTQMEAIATRLREQYPENKYKSVAVTQLQENLTRKVKPTLILLLTAVGVILLIACANVANLLLAKATSRTREVAIRAAVGASRARVIWLLVQESAVLSLAGAAVGVVLAIWGIQALVALAPANVPRVADVRIDTTVLGFTLLLSLLASVLFGLAPAIHASRIDLNDALKQSGGRAVTGGSNRLRGVLVAAEIALSVVLLSGAGLLIKSFLQLSRADLGFKPGKLLVLHTSVPASGDEGRRRAVRFYEELLPQLRSLPGVTAAGASFGLPSRKLSNGAYDVQGRPPAKPGEWPQAGFHLASPGYFAALGVPVKAGRDFDESDNATTTNLSVIVNEAFVRQTFPNQNPLGQRIRCGLDRPDWMTIIGVVGDVRESSPGQKPVAEIYMPYPQHPGPAAAMTIVLRTPLDPMSLAEAARRKVRGLRTDVPVRFTTMEATLAEAVASPRFQTLLVGIFAGVAIVLALTGLYGVMACIVSQRVMEIGIRLALGARRADVLSLVLTQGMRLVGIGIVIGLAAAFASTRLMRSLLYEVGPADPLTYAGVTALLILTAAVAIYIPAWRASKVDPLVALRLE